MDTIEIKTAAEYYDAWRNRRGDMSEAPLADDFHFVGPVAGFEARRQFVDGNMPAAELLEVEDGVIVRGELIYDAEALRRVMAA